MAASGYTPISLYYSTTASAAPVNTNLVNGELAINITDGKLYYKDNGGTVRAIAILARTNGNFGDLTDQVTLAVGTTGQRTGSPAVGMVRYNTTTNEFEGYSGSSPAWKSIGGSALSNDTTTASDYYPTFSTATTGTATNLYTSNAKLLYKPSTGELKAFAPIASNGIFVNATSIADDYTIATGFNGFSVGPVVIASGKTVVVSSGQTWVVI